jgi:CspA family cold shock protein
MPSPAQNRDGAGDLPATGFRYCKGTAFVMANYDNAGYRAGTGSSRATVKWFNATKGFGFVTLEDGSDAFCHASTLAALPCTELPQGATVVCEVAQGQRGMQVTHVHSVDLSTAEAQPAPRGAGGSGGFRPQARVPRESSGPLGGGHVKFFNEQKGFGFVVPESGGTDVYVHASALRRSGIPTLTPEQKIRFSTRQGMKGVEVDRIELA